MRTKTRLSYKKYKQTNTKAKLRLLNRNVVGYFTVGEVIQLGRSRNMVVRGVGDCRGKYVFSFISRRGVNEGLPTTTNF